MDLAIKDARQHVGKFVVTTAGVGLLITIVLVMNGIFRGNVADGLWLIRDIDADLWVVERGRGGPFNEPSRIPEDAYRSVAATPGVLRTSPFISYTVERRIAGSSHHFTIIGYDVFGSLGGPRGIVAGRGIERPRFEMVTDEKLGLVPGDRIRLGVHEITVVGTTRGAVDSGGNPVAYLSLTDAQEILYQQDNRALEQQRAASRQQLADAGLLPPQVERLLPLLAGRTETISAVLVQLAPGHRAEEVARHIEDWLYLDVFTTAEQEELMLKGRLERMTAVLGLFRSLLVVVAIVIMALLMYVLTIGKIKSIATLKLIGAGNPVIVRMIMEQSIVLTVGSFGFALLLTPLIRAWFPRNLIMLPSETLITFLVLLGGGLLASLFGIWHALRTPPSEALGG